MCLASSACCRTRRRTDYGASKTWRDGQANLEMLKKARACPRPGKFSKTAKQAVIKAGQYAFAIAGAQREFRACDHTDQCRGGCRPSYSRFMSD